MYEARQNKEKVSRRIDGGSRMQQRIKIQSKGICSDSPYSFAQSTYLRTLQTQTNKTIQGRFVIASNSTNYDTYENALANINHYIEGIVIDVFEGKIGEDDVMTFLKMLTDSKTLLPYFPPVKYIPISMQKSKEDEQMGIYKNVETKEYVSIFDNYDELIQYLIAFISHQYSVQEADDNYEENSTIAPPQQSYFHATYNRYPTIYTYGMNTGGQIDTNKQGPHTLSHVSINYLMDIAPTGYNYAKQVLGMDDVVKILHDIGVLPKENEYLKVDRYLAEYQGKLQNYQYEKEMGRTLVRELMEMHPMAVYGWVSNIKNYIRNKPRAVGHKALAGKGERYGETIFFDLNSKKMGSKTYRDNLNTQLKTYLTLRLSMSVKSDRIESIVDTLFNEGEYTLQKEDLLSYAE